MKLLPFLLLICSLSYGISECPKPLFADPHYNGSCDPEIVWNAYEREWWIFYTGRRPAVENGIYAGCAIGVVASKDWINWEFKGYCKIDGVGGVPDSNDTYWAPGIIYDGDKYHMFVTFKKGSPGLWGGRPTLLYHLTAPANDLLNGWTTQGGLDTYPHGIDAAMFKKDDLYYMYHRDIDPALQNKGFSTKYMTSRNLKDWEFLGWAKGDINDKAVNGYNYQEGQYVFYWKNKYWQLTDPSGKDLAVFESDDCIHWKYNGAILDRPGRHSTDAFEGRHPSVAIVDDRAFIFYHVEPYTPERQENKQKGKFRAKDYYAYLQIAELKVENGKLTCDRDKPVKPPFSPRPSGMYWGQSNR